MISIYCTHDCKDRGSWSDFDIGIRAGYEHMTTGVHCSRWRRQAIKFLLRRYYLLLLVIVTVRERIEMLLTQN